MIEHDGTLADFKFPHDTPFYSTSSLPPPIHALTDPHERDFLHELVLFHVRFHFESLQSGDSFYKSRLEIGPAAFQ